MGPTQTTKTAGSRRTRRRTGAHWQAGRASVGRTEGSLRALLHRGGVQRRAAWPSRAQPVASPPHFLAAVRLQGAAARLAGRPDLDGKQLALQHPFSGALPQRGKCCAALRCAVSRDVMQRTLQMRWEPARRLLFLGIYPCCGLGVGQAPPQSCAVPCCRHPAWRLLCWLRGWRWRRRPCWRLLDSVWHTTGSSSSNEMVFLAICNKTLSVTVKATVVQVQGRRRLAAAATAAAGSASTSVVGSARRIPLAVYIFCILCVRLSAPEASNAPKVCAAARALSVGSRAVASSYQAHRRSAARVQRWLLQSTAPRALGGFG